MYVCMYILCTCMYHNIFMYINTFKHVVYKVMYYYYKILLLIIIKSESFLLPVSSCKRYYKKNTFVTINRTHLLL